MRTLVFNAGSSSLKFMLDDGAQPLLRGAVNDLGDTATLDWHAGDQQAHSTVSARNHAEAAGLVLGLIAGRRLRDSPAQGSIDLIGHRVVQGNNAFCEPARVSDDMLALLESFSALAPLHNPPAVSVMRACRERLGDTPMVAVFDTAFFHDLPEHARSYALPATWRRAYRIHRYGFHGIAHRWLHQRCARIAGRAEKVITFQLGHGCSAAAIRDGRPQAISMGFTPLEGLLMATRGGAMDSGILLHLAAHGLSPQVLQRGLHHEGGLLALSGASGDMRRLLQLEAEGHAGARLAVEAFCQQARHYLGAYLAALGGADAIVFGGGIGEHAPAIRARICADMHWCGLRLDDAANQRAIGAETRISPTGASPECWVIPVDEETLIAHEARTALAAAA
jgi:acetate kinase